MIFIVIIVFLCFLYMQQAHFCEFWKLWGHTTYSIQLLLKDTDTETDTNTDMDTDLYPQRKYPVRTVINGIFNEFLIFIIRKYYV